MKIKCKSSFQDDWLLPSEKHTYHKWIARVPNDKYSAKCRPCGKIFSVSSSGVAQLESQWRETQKMNVQ